MNNFTEAIKTAIVLFPIVALLFTVPYILHQYHKYGSIHSWRTVIVYSFILYGMTAYFLVILPLPSMDFVEKMSKPAYNLQPFLFVKDILFNTGLKINDFSTYFPTMKNSVFYEAVFNIFLTVPFGVYLHYYFKCSFSKTLFFSFCLTLFFELTQLSGLYFIYPRPYRVFDVDDLILNTTGGVFGYFIGSLMLNFLPTRDEIDERSYEKGKSVSIFRRIVSLGIDFLLIGFLTFFWGLFIFGTPVTKEWIFVPFVGYYLASIWFKRTVGMSFLNLEFQSIKEKPIKWWAVWGYFFGFYMEYFFIPIGLFCLECVLYENHYLTDVMWEYAVVVLLALTLMVLILSFLKRLFHMPLFYEKLSGLQLKSTIRKPKEVTNE